VACLPPLPHLSRDHHHNRGFAAADVQAFTTRVRPVIPCRNDSLARHADCVPRARAPHPRGALIPIFKEDSVKLWNLELEELEHRLVPGLLSFGSIHLDIDLDGDNNEFDFEQDNDTVIVEDSENVTVINDSEVEDSTFIND
jgi:hypothetical protein